MLLSIEDIDIPGITIVGNIFVKLDQIAIAGKNLPPFRKVANAFDQPVAPADSERKIFIFQYKRIFKFKDSHGRGRRTLNILGINNGITAGRTFIKATRFCGNSTTSARGKLSEFRTNNGLWNLLESISRGERV